MKNLQTKSLLICQRAELHPTCQGLTITQRGTTLPGGLGGLQRLPVSGESSTIRSLHRNTGHSSQPPTVLVALHRPCPVPQL